MALRWPIDALPQPRMVRAGLAAAPCAFVRPDAEALARGLGGLAAAARPAPRRKQLRQAMELALARTRARGADRASWRCAIVPCRQRPAWRGLGVGRVGDARSQQLQISGLAAPRGWETRVGGRGAPEARLAPPPAALGAASVLSPLARAHKVPFLEP
jgi:hypothetical protein